MKKIYLTLKTICSFFISIFSVGLYSCKEAQPEEALAINTHYSLKIDNIQVIDTSLTVYNLEVEGNHNYFVGENGILVHNSIDCFDTKELKNLIDKYKADRFNKSMANIEESIQTDEIRSKMEERVRSLAKALAKESEDKLAMIEKILKHRKSQRELAAQLEAKGGDFSVNNILGAAIKRGLEISEETDSQKVEQLAKEIKDYIAGQYGNWAKKGGVWAK